MSRTWTSKGVSTALIVSFIVIIMIVASAGMLLLNGPVPASSSSSTASSSSKSTCTSTGLACVNVFGLVSTTGAGTHPVSLVFTSLTTSAIFVAPVSNGRFSIQVLNRDAYNTTVRWGGNYTWQQGETAEGRLSVNMSSGSMGAESYNLAVQTPDSVVSVMGTLSWTVVTASPVNIRFIASDGENFTTTVSADHAFTISLPNMMTYETYVQSRNSTGYTEWYSAHQVRVSADVNVVGLVVKVPL